MAGEATDLGEILVSAGRTPAPEVTVGATHTVITGEELERRQVRFVADALRAVPGLAVSQTGATGGVTQVRVRGAEANHVLVLIDGVEASEVSQGEFDFGGLLAADIERIEVIRGPQSARWGTNATAGVISIVTRGGIRNGIAGGLRLETGTDRTILINPSVRGGAEAFDFALSGVFRRNDGFNISDFGSEEDGHRNATLNARFTADLSRTLVLDGNLRYTDRSVESDEQDFSFGPNQGLVLDAFDWTDTQEALGGLGLTWSLMDGALVQEARLTANDNERQGYTAGALSLSNKGSRVVGSYQATFTLDTPSFADARHTFTAGAEWKRESFRNDPPAPPASLAEQSRRTRSLVAEYRGEFFNRLFLSGAVRFDDNDAFDDATTYSASAAYLLPNTGTRLHASVGTGVTNPTFYEQFGFDPASFVGNPNLQPEESFGWDAGIEQSFLDGRLVIDATYFRADLENEIATDFSVFPFTAINLPGTSERQGLELSLTASPLPGLSVTGSYTYILSEDGTGLSELRRPKHAAALNLGYAFPDGRARVFGDVIYNGEMPDSEFVTFGRATLDDYVLVNVGGDYALSESVTLYGRVNNLLDEDYEEIFGFNTAGVTGFVGVRLTFGGPAQ